MRDTGKLTLLKFVVQRRKRMGLLIAVLGLLIMSMGLNTRPSAAAPTAQTGVLLGTFTVDQANCTNQNGTTNTTYFQNSNNRNTLDCVIPINIDATVTDYVINYRFDPAGSSWQSESNRVDVRSPGGMLDTHTGLGGANVGTPHTYTSPVDSSLSGEGSNGDWHIIAHDTGYANGGHNLIPSATSITLYGTQNVSVGNRVWYDSNQNGEMDGLESTYGIDGVAIDLLQAGVVVSSTATTNGGYYQFNSDTAGNLLTNGAYSVRVNGSNFGAAGSAAPLDDWVSSSPDDVGDAIDNNDNGQGAGSGIDVESNIVALVSGTEPINDGDGSSGNLTIDFGFHDACSVPNGDLGGNVFRDFNSDGIQTDNEPGWNSDITITAYDNDGNPVTTTLNPDGSYDFDGLFPNSTTAADHIRLEFSGLPSWAYSTYAGANNGTAVQIHKAATCDADAGFHNPADFCQSNPDIVTSCYLNGGSGGTFATGEAAVILPYNASGYDFDANAMATANFQGTKIADWQTIGSTFGISWQSSTERLYFASFYKRLAGLGPNGPDAIYQMDKAGNVTGVIELDNYLPGTDTAGADVHDFVTLTGNSKDIDSVAAVGTTSFGGTAISDDASTLYVMNLFDRKLYALDVATGNVADVSLVNTPGSATDFGWDTPDACGPTVEHRPFAVTAHDGKLYVGSVCEDASNAHVHVLDPAGTTWTLEATLPLDYPRDPGYLSYGNGATQPPTSAHPGAWNPWINDVTALGVAAENVDSNTGVSEISYPVPWLTDIEIDSVDGSLVLGLRDRFADQTGQAARIAPNTRVASSISAGDMVRLCKIGTTYAPEGSPSCPAPDGELYTADEWGADYGRGYATFHEEIFMGGLVHLPGSGEVMTSLIDPDDNNRNGDFSAGVQTHDIRTGAEIRDYTIYDTGNFSTGVPTGATFGKGGGLGGLDALCDAAPLEIGNYVWLDDDGDGIQDPCEEPLANIDVVLTDSTGNTFTTTTNAAGEYYFNQTNVTGGLVPSSTYTLTINMVQPQFALLDVTLQDATSGTTLPDSVDSDAREENRIAIIPLTTGLAGQNNHTLDFGFTPAKDYGDLPDGDGTAGTNSPNYNTNLTGTVGASHVITTSLFLGGLVDGEKDGQPSVDATGDDTVTSIIGAGTGVGTADDEDGVTFPSLTVAGNTLTNTFLAGQTINITTTVTNVTGEDAFVYAFIDWNGDGLFTGPNEVVSKTVGTGANGGTETLQVTVPAGADTTQRLGARIRLSTDPNLGPDGAAPDGEIEDYLVRVFATDFGDLPDGDSGTGGATNSPNYNTDLTGAGGPSHIIVPGLKIGPAVDGEVDGQPSATAVGDDTNGTGDDEDGIAFPVLTPGVSATITATVVNTTTEAATLYSFFDWNGDGDFGDANETVTTNVPAGTNGSVFVNVTIPVDAETTEQLGARFRLSTDGGLTADGVASDGEVEDYLIELLTVEIGNQVWIEDDNDGIATTGTITPVIGTVVTATSAAGTVYTATTDANGFYTMTVPANTTYTVVVGTPAKTLPAVPNGGLVANDNDPNTNNQVSHDSSGTSVTVGTENNYTIDFGFFDPNPEIDLEKATNGEDADTVTGPTLALGDPVAWTYQITNTGNVTLTTITLNDDVEGAIVCPAGPLAVGATRTCTATGIAAVGQYTNTATVSGVPTLGPTDPVTDTDPSHYIVPLDPSIDVEKATNGEDADAVAGPTLTLGDEVTWTYQITNTGNVTLTTITLNDDVEGAITCPAGPLAVGATRTCTATGIAAVGQYTNTASVSGVPTLGPTDPVTDTDPSHYIVPLDPSIDVEKATNGDDADTVTGPTLALGDVVTWTYQITNTGNVTLTTITLNDDVEGAITCPAGPLAVGATRTCTATGIAAVGQYTNTASVSGVPTLGPTDPVTDTDPSHYIVPLDPSIDVEKATNGDDADTVTGPELRLGDTVTWTYEITNTGNVTLTTITLNDDVEGAITCPAGDLAVGASKTCVLTSVVTDLGQYTNTATVSAVPTILSTDPVTDTDPSHYVVPTVEIGNQVWIESDSDGNATTGTITPVPGTLVTAIAPDGTVYTATTDANGFYTITVQANDAYTVTVATPAGVVPSVPAGGLITADNNPATNNQISHNGAGTLVAVGTENNYTIDFGFHAEVQFGNQVWIEDDNDGIATTGTITPVVGTIVTAISPATGAVYTTTTDANGFYTFTVPANDTYNVTVATPANTVPAVPNGGLIATDNDPNSNNQTSHDGAGTVVILGTDDNFTIDFGFFDPKPAIDLEKATNGDDADAVTGPTLALGDPVAWTYEITNTGNVTLTNIALNDDVEGAVTTCLATELAPGGTTTCLLNGIAAVGQYTNTADVSGVPSLGSTDPVTDTDPSHYIVPLDPSIDVEKATNGDDADTTTGPELRLGDTVTWTYEITNTGNVTLTTITLIDDVEGAITCPAGDLAVGASKTCVLTSIVTDLGQYTNTASVSAVPTILSTDPVTDSDPSHYVVPLVEIGNQVWIESDSDGDATTGTITPVPFVEVTAVASDGTVYTATTNASGFYTITVQADDIYTVTVATPAGTVPSVPAGGLIDTDNSPFTNNQLSHDGAGTRVVVDTANNYTIDFGFHEEVQFGNQVWIEDDNDGIASTGTITPVQFTEVRAIASDGTVYTTTTDVNGFYTFTVPANDTYNVTVATPANTVPAVPNGGLIATDNDPNNNDQTSHDGGGTAVTLGTDDNFTIDFGFFDPQPAIDVEKLTNGENADTVPGPILALGDAVTWTYDITNTGNVTLTTISLTDTPEGAVTCGFTELAPGEFGSCTLIGVAGAGQYINTAVVSGVPALGPTDPVTDTDPSHYSVPAEPAIVVEKSTNGDDADTVTGPELRLGDTVTWTYEIVNSGNITLTNITLLDDVEGVVTTCPAGDLAVGASKTCVLTSVVTDLGQYTNTASVSAVPTILSTDPVTDSDPSHYIVPSVEIGNQVWIESDSDGLAGTGTITTVPFTLVTAIAPDGTVYTATTDANGFYTITVQADDAYTVTVATPAGTVPSIPAGGLIDNDNSPFTFDQRSHDSSGTLVTVQRVDNYTIDFGFHAEVQFGNQVWIEDDNDGLASTGTTTPVIGTVVTATSPATGAVYTTTTDANGFYTFTVPANDTYNVTVATPANTVSAVPNGGLITVDNDPATNDQTSHDGAGTAVTLGTEDNFTIDFGFFSPQPAIDLEKATNGEDADTATGPTLALGDPVAWTYEITNTGNVTLTNITLNDDVEGAVTTCLATELAPGGATTCLLNGIAAVGQYTNTAAVSGVPTLGVATPVTDTDPSHYIIPYAPAIVVEKATNGDDADVLPGPTLALGDSVTWTYQITNTGNVTLTTITLNDDVEGAITCPAGPLAVGASRTCTATSIAAVGQYTNTATVSGIPTEGPTTPVTDTDPSHYTVPFEPTIDVEKSTNGDDADTGTGPTLAVGDTVTWTYDITNTGNVTLTTITVVDDVEGNITCGFSELPVGATGTCTLVGIATVGPYTNTAVVSGIPELGPTDPITDTDSSHYDVPYAPAIIVEKATNGDDADVLPGPTLALGDAVVWTYQVTNTGNVTLTTITLTDDVEGAITCPAGPLAAGASRTCTANGIAAVGQYTNTATVSGIPTEGPTTPVTDTDPSHYTVPFEPTIDVEKSTNGDDADTGTGPMLAVGDTVTWTYDITNTGNVTLTTITVVDDVEGTITCGFAELAVGASGTCTLVRVATVGPYTNTAVVSAIPELGPTDPITDTDSSHYDVPYQPAIIVEKATNSDDADVLPGPTLALGDAVIWTYQITNTGNVTLTTITLNDDVEGVIACPAGPLAVGATLTCTATGIAAVGQYTNTATVSGIPTEGPTTPVTDTDPSHYSVPLAPSIDVEKATSGDDADATTGPELRLGDTVTWTYEITNTGNVTLTNITLLDDVEGAVTTCPAGDLAVGDSKTCVLTSVVTDLGQYTNTATVSGVPTILSTDPVTDSDPSHYIVPTVEIGNQVWIESDSDGDASTGTITPVPFTLVTAIASDGTVYTAMTDANGFYTITVQANDAYTVTVATPAGTVPSIPAGGLITADNDPATSNQISHDGAGTLVTVDTNNNYTIDFGFHEEVQFGNQIWIEDDNDGIASTGTITPVVGTVVTAISPATGAVYTTTTDANGFYTFTVPANDTYNVTVATPANTVPAVPNGGLIAADNDPATNDQTSHDGAGTAVTLGTDDNFTIDFGFFDAQPAIELEKATNGEDADTVTGPILTLGDAVTWTYALTNTGNVTLTNITLNDDVEGAIICPVAELGIGETTTCVATGIAAVGQYTNTAAVSGVPTLGSTDPVTDSDPSHYIVPLTPSIDVEKATNGDDADATTGPELRLGDTVTWTYQITNTGNVTLTNITLLDDVEGVVTTCPAGDLAVGASKTCVLTSVVTDLGQYTNTATVSGVPTILSTDPVTDSDPSHYIVPTVEIGNQVWIESDSDGDASTGAITPVPFTLVTAVASDGTIYTTTTDVNGFYTITVQADDAYTVTVATPAGTVPSIPAGGLITADNDPATNNQISHDGAGTLVTVQRANNYTIDFGFHEEVQFGNQVWIEDDNDGIASTGTITPVQFTEVRAVAGDGTVYTTTTDANGFYTFTVPANDTYTVTVGTPTGTVPAVPNGGLIAADNDPNSNNQVSHDGAGTAVTLGMDDNFTVDFGFFDPQPAIDLEKSTNGEDADTVTGPILTLGDVVTWTYAITNTGNVTLTNITLTDDVEGAVTTCLATELAPGGTTICLLNGIAAVGQYTNTATVSGVPTLGVATPVTDSDPSHYIVTLDPSIEVEKATNGDDADTTTGPELRLGDTVTWTYQITNTGNVTLTSITLLDDVEGAVTTCPAGDLPVGASKTCVLTRVVTDLGQYTNMATVSGVPTILSTGPVTDSDPSHYFVPTVEIGNQVWIESDSDGDASTGTITPVPFTLVTAVASDGTVYTATTDANGFYTITVQVDDVYTVTVGTPAGTVPSIPTGGLITADNDPATNNQISHDGAGTLVTVQRANNYTIDFGFHAEVQFGNQVWIEDDNDGIASTGTITPVQFTEVRAVASDGTVYTTTTDANGFYTFTVPANDTYNVAVGTPANTIPAVPNGGLIATDNDPATNNQTSHDGAGTAVTLGTDDNFTIDFGFFNPQPAITVEKSTNGDDADTLPGPILAVGDSVTWTYQIMNTGNVTLTTIALTDDVEGTIICPAGPLGVGASRTCALTGIATLGQYTNTASVSGVPTLGPTNPVTDTDTSHYNAPAAPAIIVEKSTNGDDADTGTGPTLAVGDAVTWTYEIRNSGNVTLTTITLIDDIEGAVTCPAGPLAVGASRTCTLAGIARLGQYTNTATVSGIPTEGPMTPVTDTDPSHYNVPFEPSIDLEKATNGDDADSSAGPLLVVGDAVTWTYAITNTGNVTLTSITLNDDVEGAVACGFSELTPGGSGVCTLNGIAGVGPYTNTATVSGIPQIGPTDPVTDSDVSHYQVPIGPAIEVEKSTNGADADALPGITLRLGDTITWTYEIRNIGNVTLTNIALTDDIEGAITCPAGPLAVGVTRTCVLTSTVTVFGPYANIGTVSGVPTVGPPIVITDTDSSSYNVPSVEIGNQVWIEDDGDGLAATGTITPVVGTVVTAVASDGTIYTGTTDANGFYTITVQANDSYTVTVGTPAGTVPAVPSGGLISIDNDPNSGDQTSHNPAGTVVTVGTDDNRTIDFGFARQVAIGNVVWIDEGAGGGNPRNGILDGGEQGVPGVVVELYRTGDTPGVSTPFLTTTTSGTGEYLFDMLPEGSYQVHIPASEFMLGEPLSSFASSPSNGGDNALDDNGDENGIDSLDPRITGISSDPIQLTVGGEPAGETGQGSYPGNLPDENVNMAVDFGFFELLTLGNQVWFDDDDNGIYDPGELDVGAGVVLYLLDGNGNGIPHPVTGLPISATTDANGVYIFTNLFPGDYQVLIGPENFEVGRPLEGYTSSTGAVDPDNDSDRDDNGLDSDDPVGRGIVSDPVTLDFNDEPDQNQDSDDNNNTNLSVDFGVILTPTAVELISFTVQRAGESGATVRWETASEIDNFGFRLMRSRDGELANGTQIHFESSAVTTGPGVSYEFADSGLEVGGTYTYWLIDVETTGKEVVHGPIVLTLNRPFTIFLPTITR